MRIGIYAGQYYDDETGLHYNYHRYYDPKTGRYLTPDPIGLRGGINLFTYTSNNPINFTDPLGLADVGMAGWGNVQFSIQGLNPGVHPVFQRGTFENQLIGKDLIKIGGFLRETSGFEGWANTLVWLANSIVGPDDSTSVEEWLKWKGVNPGDLCEEKAEPWQPIMGGYNPEDPPPPPPNEPRWKKIARVIMKLIRAANPK